MAYQCCLLRLVATCYHYTDGSCPIAAECYAEKMPELSNVLHNDFNCCERATETKSDFKSGIIFSNVEYGSIPGATLQLEDHSNNVFPVSSCNVLNFVTYLLSLGPKQFFLTPRYSFPINTQVKSVCLGSDAIDSMTERSPSDISNNHGLIQQILFIFLSCLLSSLTFCFRNDAVLLKYGIFVEVEPLLIIST